MNLNAKTLLTFLAAVAAGLLAVTLYLRSTVIVPPGVEPPPSAPSPAQPPPPPKRDVPDFIHVFTPTANTPIESPLDITGEARGMWYFEASFPIELLDEKGNVVAAAVAQAQDEWMTENFVPFKVTMTFKAQPPGGGTLVFHKDNPSGLPEHDAELRIPVRFPPPSATGEGDDAAGGVMPKCRPTGCSGQICADQDVVTTCEYRPEYACYKNARCERQANGKCGWTQDEELDLCLQGVAQPL